MSAKYFHLVAMLRGLERKMRAIIRNILNRTVVNLMIIPLSNQFLFFEKDARRKPYVVPE